MLLKWLIFLSIFSINIAFAEEAKIRELIVFGDSYSDTGYSEEGAGFNRYSNGKVWPEYISSKLCDKCLKVMAWGGAKSDCSNVNGPNWSGLKWQIDSFDFDNDLDHKLFTIWFGVNDVIEGIDNNSAENILKSSEYLIKNHKVKNLVIFNLHDIHMAPVYVNPKDKSYSEYHKLKDKVHKLVIKHNTNLAKGVEILKSKYPDAKIVLFDINKYYKKFMHNGHLDNIDTAWIGSYLNPAEHKYFWWDSWHPMTNIHKETAKYLLEDLASHNIIIEGKRN